MAQAAVTRLHGKTPVLSESRFATVPPSFDVKVCIDIAGRVSTVEVPDGLDAVMASELTDTIKDWKYVPYKQNDTAMPACFNVNFRAKYSSDAGVLVSNLR